MTLEVVYEDESCRQAYLGPVHLVAWFDAPSVDQMRAYGRCAQGLSRRSGADGTTGLFNLIVRGRPRFDPEVRRQAKVLTERGVHAGGTAHVVLATGLVGAAARAFMSTTVLLARPKNPTRVFGELEAAAGWLGDHLDVESRELVIAALELSAS